VEWLRRERNEIFAAVRAGDLDPAECELAFKGVWVRKYGEHIQWSELYRPKPNAAYISHPPSGSSFLIVEPDGEVSRNGFTVIAAVPDGPSADHVDVTWEKLQEVIPPWAREARYIAEHPDLWQKAKQERKILSAAQQDQVSSAPFTAAEQEEIASRIEEIKAQARKNPELTAEQISGIEMRLDDLKEASERVGKKDWLVMMYGAAFGLFVNDLVPQHVVQSIITMTITGLGHIFGTGGLPPALPAQG
jgi:hypothetical protein